MTRKMFLFYFNGLFYYEIIGIAIQHVFAVRVVDIIRSYRLEEIRWKP